MSGILRIIDQRGDPIEGVQVRACIVGQEFALSSYVNNDSLPFITDADGMVSIPILPLSSFADGCAIYRITIGDSNNRHSFQIVPPDTTDDFDILDARIK